MAEISLRAYVKELDDLIEHEQLDEAIAHCRHILQTYPKHLDVYRLLGKSYLEAKRYGDAADIFQRVLSAIPDDFVAHIGMAIVREDEGNLDAAIWHMERAFETNPSNPAIQQELRRLIGRRDGLEPHKVRLTRGALARMYAHGELHAQAIAELRSALQEDPDRPDLQVLLAEMYWRLGQRNEAAEVCQKILESLPFCREANRIMAAALQAGGQVEDAVTYHRRLASLDPYAALVESAMDDPTRVEPNAVRIEKLAWVPGQPVPGGEGGQPEWASSLGVDVRSDAARAAAPKRPSWLDSLESETAAARAHEAAPPVVERAAPPPPQAPQKVPATEAEGETVRAIPDWMRSAGWSESSGQVAEGPVSFSESEMASLEAGTLPPPDGELAPADIPDWLKDIAPTDRAPEPETPAETPTPAPDEGDWLQAGAPVSAADEAPRLPPGWGGQAPAAPPPATRAEPAAETPATPPPSVPTWMEEAAPGATETIVTWLGDRSKEALGRGPRPEPPAPEPEATPEAEPDLFQQAIPEGVPDWLSEDVSWGAAGGAKPEAAEQEPERPAWLTGVAAAAAEGDSIKPEELSWKPAEGEPAAALGMYAEEPAEPASPAGDVPDWIKAIADSDFGAGQTPVEAEAEAPDVGERLDWLSQGEGLSTPAAPAPEPDWMNEAPRATTPAKVQPPAQEEGVEVPTESLAWLRELAEAEPPSPPGRDEQGEEAAPGWLRGISEERPTRSPLGRSSAPEWMRGIAEPEPEPGSGLSEEGTLDWMRGIAEGEPPAPMPSAGVIAAPQPAEPAHGEGEHEWLSLMGGEHAPASSTSTGEWLRRLKDEGVPAAETAAPLPPAEEPAAALPSENALDDEQVFEWLESLAARQGPEEAGPAPAETPSAPRPTPSGPARPLPEGPAEGLEWLEKLAAERGIDAQVRPSAPATAPAPPPLAPTPPLMPRPAQPQPVASQPPPSQPPPEVPDWLRELVAESGQAPEEPARPAPPPPTTKPSPVAETWPALPAWMLASSQEETEPVVPLPPSASSPPDEIGIPTREDIAAEPVTSAPMEELAEGWVPPWESLEFEAAQTPPSPPLPTTGPSDETVYVPPRRPSAIDETVIRMPARMLEPEPQMEDRLPPEPPRPPEPAPAMSEEAEDEIPDWLQTPIPYAPTKTRPPVYAPPAVETPPPPAVAAPPPAPEPVAARVQPEPLPMMTPPPPPVVQPPAPVVAPVAPIAPPVAPPVVEAALVAPPTPATTPLPAPPIMEERRVEAVPPPMAPAVPAAKPARAPRTGRGGVDPSHILEGARKALATGDYPKAASNYGTLIKRNFEVQAIAEELRLALDRNPRTPSLWQTLGDAYMKGDRLQDAIEAYRRGMEAA